MYVFSLLVCRCVLNWFGDWSTGALYQVGYEFTNRVDLDRSDVSYELTFTITHVFFVKLACPDVLYFVSNDAYFMS